MAERTWQTPPLREALAGLLRDTGDIVGAVRLFDDEYRRNPSLAAYRRLLDEADLLGERATSGARRSTTCAAGSRRNQRPAWPSVGRADRDPPVRRRDRRRLGGRQ